MISTEPRLKRIMQTMFALPSKLLSMTWRMASFMLVLWLAGLGCLIGCETSMAAEDKANSQTAAEAESCAVSSEHDCCRKVDDTANVDIIPLATNINCFQPSGISADPARKITAHDLTNVVVQSGLPLLPELRVSTPTPLHRSRLPDRGGTRLRCCVFLI